MSDDPFDMMSALKKALTDRGDRRFVCQMGDNVWLDAKETAFEPCGEVATHRVTVNGAVTHACLRHATEALDVADDIKPRLPTVSSARPAQPREGR